MAQGRPDPSRGVGTPQTTGPPFYCADSYYEERPPASWQHPGPGNFSPGCDQIHPVRVSSKISVPKTLCVRGQAGSDRVKRDVWKKQLWLDAS